MRWRERVFGDEDRLGWWLIPMFLVVGLAGAVLAGSLTVVYYGQQVERLRSETAEGRDEIAGAAEEVRDAADEALEAMAEEVAAFRDRLALPAEDAAERGVVRLQIDTEVTVQGAAVSEPRTAPQPDEGEAGDPGDAGDPDDGTQPEDDPDADDPGDDVDEPAAPPPPQEQVRVARSATGFVVVRDGDEAFIVTTFAFLADPRRSDVPLDVPVTVRTVAGDTTAAVHSWDVDRGLVLLRTRLGAVEPLEWRPADEEVVVGDRIVGVGLTPQLALVRIGGELGTPQGAAMASDLPVLAALEGGPVVDVDGRVIGVSTPQLRGFGGDPGIVSVRVLCERLLSACPP